MERLTVGNNRPFPGKTTLTRVPPPSNRYRPPVTAPPVEEQPLPPKEPPKDPPGSPSPHRDRDRPSHRPPHPSPHGREAAGPASRPFLSSLPSPEQPLLRLMGRDIYPEDLMLILLILTLKEDDADPGLVAALIYLLFC